MGLSYHFTLSAPASAKAAELEQFLKTEEAKAQTMGFHPTMVLNVPLDTVARREFARRLTTGLFIEDSRLAGLVFPVSDQLWGHDVIGGSCRVMPKQAVALVVTDERRRECCFGFFRYPDEILDIHGKTIASTGLSGSWLQREFIDSPDPRYREIIRMFADAGFLDSVKDEYG